MGFIESMLKGFKIILPVAKFLLISSSPIVVPTLFWYWYYRLVKKMEPIEDEREKYEESNFFKKLFWDFPKQLAYDKLTRDPNEFPQYGVHMVCGKQGAGKTTVAAYLANKYMDIYPKLWVSSNFGFKRQTYPLTGLDDLTLDKDTTNGIYGELILFDELHATFDTNASRTFSPQFLRIITQQRKVRRCIIGTAQVFPRLAKQLRENTYLLYYPITIFGCLTFCIKYEPEFDFDGNVKKRKIRGFFFFVQTPALRSLFDSYETVVSLGKSGMKPASEQLDNTIYNQTKQPQ